MRIVVAARARREILAAAAWWRENREAAPNLFEHELRRALILLEAAPHTGRRVIGARVSDARVVVLQRTGYLLFYRLVDDEVVRVLSLNHGRRGNNPPI